MAPERANELWDLFLAEKLDDAGARELLAYLQANPDELQHRRLEASIHGGLRYLFGNDEESRRLMASVQARLKINVIPGEESGFAKRVMTDVRLRPKRHAQAGSAWWIAAAAAAVLLIAGLSALHFQAGKTTPESVVVQPDASMNVTIELQSGRARIGTRNLQAPVETRLATGETLTLEGSSRARVPLPDGTDVQISEGAALTLIHVEAPILLKLEHGIAEIDVRPQPAGKEMVLETRQARVRVLGTKYRVLATESASRVDVERGKVSVASLITKTPERTLEIGQAVTVDREGVGAVLAARARTLSPNDAQVEGFTDPVQFSACDTPAPWPARRLTYTRPAQKGLGYGGAVWKTGFEAGEDSLELWIRPRRVELVKPENRLMKVVLLISTGPTEYRVGDIQIFPADREWMLLRGRFAGATVNWQEPGSPAMPLLPQNVRQLSLRTEIGNIEFDFGPVQIQQSRP